MNETNLHWMCLAKDEGQLLVHEYVPDQHQAYFNGVTRSEIIVMTGKGLEREDRFCHMMKQQVSVAQHSLWLWSFMLEFGNPALAMHSLFHDTPEAYLHDMPKMLKSPLRASIEDAVYVAFGWPELPMDEGDHAVFKRWDEIAAIAEGELFGYKWPWLAVRRKAYKDEPVDLYRNHIIRTGRAGDPAFLWSHTAFKYCAEQEISIEEQLKAPQDLLAQREIHINHLDTAK